jgi:hypothetical protein
MLLENSSTIIPFVITFAIGYVFGLVTLWYLYQMWYQPFIGYLDAVRLERRAREVLEKEQ